MRHRKTIPKESIVEVYGQHKGVKTLTKANSKNALIKDIEDYYYRHKGYWYPSTRKNLIKRGIIKEAPIK